MFNLSEKCYWKIVTLEDLNCRFKWNMKGKGENMELEKRKCGKYKHRKGPKRTRKGPKKRDRKAPKSMWSRYLPKRRESTLPPSRLFIHPLANLPTHSLVRTHLPIYPCTNCTYLTPWLILWMYVSLLVYLLALLTWPKMTKKDILVVRNASNHTT